MGDRYIHACHDCGVVHSNDGKYEPLERCPACKSTFDFWRIQVG